MVETIFGELKRYVGFGPDDECDWVFTSGTTALPKAAAFTQRACVATGIGVARSWELVPGDTTADAA